MTVDAPTPLPERAGDHDRERALRLMREGVGEGRLSLDTFSDRVERAQTARSREQLDALVGDLEPRGLVERLLAGATRRASELSARLEATWREPRLPRLRLPDRDGEFTLGRADDCDCVLSDTTISRHHARLRHAGQTWLLRDLSSTNGTRVNGWHVLEEVEVRPGDRVSFGAARYRLSLDG